MEAQRASLASDRQQLVSGTVIDYQAIMLGTYDALIGVLRFPNRTVAGAKSDEPLSTTIGALQDVRDVAFVVSAAVLGARGAARVAARATSAEAGLAKQAFWGRAETLPDHFARHGADVGAATTESYAQSASSLLVRSQLNGLPTTIDASGIIRVYDPANLLFGVSMPMAQLGRSFRQPAAPRTSPNNQEFRYGILEQDLPVPCLRIRSTA